MPHEGGLLQAVVIFLTAAVIAVPLAKFLKLGAVLGYLLAGVVIGPSVLSLVNDPQSVTHISELGVVLLLFIIGLELSPRRLWVMRKAVFGAGLAQVLLTGVLIAAIAALLFGQSLEAAVVLGLGLALSSTAFGLQVLAERKELNSAHGRQAFAILLFQDIAAIPLIALVPLLSGVGAAGAAEGDLVPVLKVLGSIGIVVVGGRYLLRPVFRIVVGTGIQEVSTATALLVVIGTAWLMELAGVSMALGAFLAGLLLADSEYRHELESQIQPFKGLLLGLFFISVGMTANMELLLVTPGLVLLLTAGLLLLKLPLLCLVGKLMGGLDARSALRLGVVLATGGEFAFVVFKMAQDQGLLSSSVHGYLVLAITLSMALAPLLMILVERLTRRPPEPQEVPEDYSNIDSDEPRVLIAGMGRVGQIVARVLHAQRVPFVALDTEVESIELSRSVAQMPIYYGDPLRPEILRAAGIASVKLFVIATDDPETTVGIAELVRRLYPDIRVIARARNRQHALQLVRLGVDPIRETFHSSLEMSRQALVGLGLSADQAGTRIKRFQRHDEDVLKAQQAVFDDKAAVIQAARDARAELEGLFASDLLDTPQKD